MDVMLGVTITIGITAIWADNAARFGLKSSFAIRVVQNRKICLGLQRFTVAEMLVALTITSIVIGAAGALVYAVGYAADSTEAMNSSRQSWRYATLRIGECVRHGKLAVRIPTNGIAIWTRDENGDNQINGSELVYIESVPGDGGLEKLQMLEFPGESMIVTIGEITAGSARSALLAAAAERITVLADNCTNTSFAQGWLSDEHVNVKFGIVEDGITTNYQISAKVAGSADNLIDQSGELVGGDDD